MAEIEVGEYVRTKDGVIGKVIKVLSTRVFLNSLGYAVLIKDIVNHSKQLIDLIEIKDVIKYRINNISTTLETKGYVEGIVDISDEEMLQRIKSDKNYHILAILTKEQMEANQYVVK